LSGGDITAAKAWALRRPKDAPEPTVLHLDFIRASEEAEIVDTSKMVDDVINKLEARAEALRLTILDLKGLRPEMADSIPSSASLFDEIRALVARHQGAARPAR
jgi:hypothetical protein